MDSSTITGLEELDHHLDGLVQDVSLAADAKLFDHVELQLTESNIPPLIPHLLPKLITILKQYTQDPAVLVSLSIKLLGPVPFTAVLGLAPEESLIQALRSPSPAANLLAMTVLHKAARSPTEAATLSAMEGLVPELIRRWLAAPQVEVGEKGGRVLGDLLETDSELPPPPQPVGHQAFGTQAQRRRTPGQGRMWRRVFQDPAVYGLIIDLCAGRHADTRDDEKQLSLAQGRLLRVLPRLAGLNFRAVSESASAVVTPLHATNGNGTGVASQARQSGGLLHFAALDMVDRRDVLMHLSLLDFFEAFVSVMRITERSPYKIEIIRSLLREATAQDNDLKTALLSLPDRTVPEEADDLRQWLGEILPGQSVRIEAIR